MNKKERYRLYSEDCNNPVTKAWAWIEVYVPPVLWLEQRAVRLWFIVRHPVITAKDWTG